MASAAILSGGASRRYSGRNKGGLLVNGRTILERQLEILRPLTDDLMLVGGRPESAVAGTRTVPDLHPGLGPLAGLEAALGAARDDLVIVLACDLPCVTGPFLEHLLELAPDVDAVVPHTNRGYHPLCAVYHRRCLEAVRRQLADGELALRGLLDGLRVARVLPETLGRFGGERRLLANVNTPADLDELETFLSHEP